MPLEFSAKISEHPMSATLTPAQEMRSMIRDGVNARLSIGLSEALHQIARGLRISTRRARAIYNGECARVWADEIDAARLWYAQECSRQEAVFQHKAALCAARRQAILETVPHEFQHMDRSHISRGLQPQDLLDGSGRGDVGGGVSVSMGG